MIVGVRTQRRVLTRVFLDTLVFLVNTIINSFDVIIYTAIK